MSYLDLADTKISSVLNSNANPLLTQFDRIFGNTYSTTDLQQPPLIITKIGV